MHSQYQVRIIMETLNVLCGATKAPSALMKIHALIIEESRREEINEETKVLSNILESCHFHGKPSEWPGPMRIVHA